MSFLDFLEKWSPIIVATISIVVAIISFVKSSKAQKLQNKVNVLEVKIKEFELEKINKQKEEEQTSCVEARIIKTEPRNYKMKIWNSGKVIVKNVSASIPSDAQIVLGKEKMPFEILEPNKSFEEYVIRHGNSKSKFIITTEWEDNNGIVHKKEQMVGI